MCRQKLDDYSEVVTTIYIQESGAYSYYKIYVKGIFFVKLILTTASSFLKMISNTIIVYAKEFIIVGQYIL